MHVNRVNGKKYVGFTSKTMEERWQKHCQAARTSELYFHRAIREHGEEAWDHVVLAFNIEELVRAQDLERKFINEHRSFDPNIGYNLTMGGDGCVMTPETRQKLSESLRGNETLREALRGRAFSEEQRRKIGNFHRGRKRSEETRQRLRDSHAGPRKPLSEETKMKLSDALKRSWEHRRVT